MSATYRYVTDTAYFKALMERYYRQRIWAIRPWGQFAILTAPLGLAFIYRVGDECLVDHRRWIRI